MLSNPRLQTALLVICFICFFSARGSSKHLLPAVHSVDPPLCSVEQPACDPHFTYTPGPHGPDHWGGECNSGKRQSPVNIDQAQSADLPPLGFDYKSSALNILNDCNHWTIKINYEGDSSIKVGNATYKLVQFHFHEPSEEAIHSLRQAMVVHLVHQNGDKVAVVAALVKVGKENPLIKTLWANIPPAGEDKHHPEIQINAKELLPENRGYYTLTGSLTTPECNEGVTWFVLKTPIEFSQAQIDKYMYHGTARPLQPLNGRPIRQTR